MYFSTFSFPACHALMAGQGPFMSVFIALDALLLSLFHARGTALQPCAAGYLSAAVIDTLVMHVGNAVRKSHFKALTYQEVRWICQIMSLPKASEIL